MPFSRISCIVFYVVALAMLGANLRILAGQQDIRSSVYSAPGFARQTSQRIPKWLTPKSSNQSVDKTHPGPDTIRDLIEIEKRVARLLPGVLSAVVAIEGGSGVIVSQDGYLLTAAHINGEPGRVVKVVLADGRVEWARTLGRNQNTDTAAMKLVGPGPWPSLNIGDSTNIRTGDWCLAIGYPLSFNRRANAPVRLGRVLDHDDSQLVTDCLLMGGDSGGALVDLNGNLIAVHSRIKRDLKQNLHTPIKIFQAEWPELAASHDVSIIDRRDSEPVGSDKLNEKRDSDSKPGQELTFTKDATPRSDFSSVLQPIQKKISDHVIEVGSSTANRTLATIVSQAGLVIAKHSDLTSPIVCQFDGQSVPGKLIAIDRANDLALIELDTVFASAIGFPRSPIPSLTGKMVVTITPNPASSILGVVSLEPGVNRPGPRSDSGSRPLLTNNRWGGGPFSQKRFGFAKVITHDSIITPQQCGSPLTDLHGNVIGINISRALRVATFAIPIEAVQKLVSQHRPQAPLRFVD